MEGIEGAETVHLTSGHPYMKQVDQVGHMASVVDQLANQKIGETGRSGQDSSSPKQACCPLQA